jgi:hypothetical protein
VAVQELVVHDTFSELKEQPVSGTRTRPPARRPVARREVRGVENMCRA